MAWALKEPMGFGDYWPDGTFQKFDEYVEDYFETNLTPEERAKFDDRHVVYNNSIIAKFKSNKGVVLPHEYPKSFELDRSYKDLSSFISTENRIVAVDDRLKKIIESIEPDIHQFIPIKLVMPRNKIYPKDYYILVIHQYIEAYIPVEGTFNPHGASTTIYLSDGYTKKDFNKLQISKEAIGSAHLWRDTRLANPNIFISDQLQAAIKDAGLKMVRHYQVKEV